jgi:hypothetical protein
LNQNNCQPDTLTTFILIKKSKNKLKSNLKKEPSPKHAINLEVNHVQLEYMIAASQLIKHFRDFKASTNSTR